MCTISLCLTSFSLPFQCVFQIPLNNSSISTPTFPSAAQAAVMQITLPPNLERLNFKDICIRKPI